MFWILVKFHFALLNFDLLCSVLRWITTFAKIEALLVEQKAAIENFNKYYSDFKKESTEIQTVDYLKAVTGRKTKIWNYIRARENAMQPYFAQDLFKEIQILNATFISEINEIVKKKTIRPRLTEFAMEDTSLIIGMQQAELLELIQNAEIIDNNSQPGVIKSTLEMLSIVWAEFRAAMYRERTSGNPIPAQYGNMQQRYMEYGMSW